jgi:hypothetical protein
VRLVDRRATAGGIDFKVVAANTALSGPAGPLRVTLVLGATGSDGLDGRCGTHDFQPAACRAGKEAHEFVCRPG